VSESYSKSGLIPVAAYHYPLTPPSGMKIASPLRRCMSRMVSVGHSALKFTVVTAELPPKKLDSDSIQYVAMANRDQSVVSAPDAAWRASKVLRQAAISC